MKLWLKLDDVDEYDVKFGAWQIYRHVYKDFLGKFDYDEDVEKYKRQKDGSISKEKCRPYITKRIERNGSICEIRLSGETDFNFGQKKIPGWGRTKTQHYKELLSNEKDDLMIEHLKKCSKKHHSQENISIMPQNGALQLVKQGIGNDRIDTFIFILAQYYYSESNLLFNYCSVEYMKDLKAYLDCFENIYDYCNTIYLIDAKLVNKMIDSGKKSIDSAERVIEYMDLAEEFWNQKKIYIDKVIE